MNVILATGIFFPDVGGPATHVRRIADALHARKVNVVVVAYGNTVAGSFPYPVKRVARWFPLPIRMMFYFFTVLGVARRGDVVYAFDLTSAGLPARLAAMFTRSRFILRIGGDPIWERVVEKGKRFLSIEAYYAQGLQRKDKPLLEKVIRFVVGGADTVVVYAQIMKDFYARHFGVDEHRIVIIKNPYEKKESASEILPENPILLFAGRFVLYKNLERCVRVFVSLRKKIGKGEFLLIGDGPEKDNLQKLIKREKAESYIRILPSVSQSELFEYIRNVAVSIAPAITEFNPNFILESISLGKPVLISRGNGLSVSLPEEYMFDPLNDAQIIQCLEELFTKDGYAKAVRYVESLPGGRGWDIVVGEQMSVIFSRT